MNISKKFQASIPYHGLLIERLKDPKACVGYLNAVLNEGNEDAFLVALHDVAQAQGGIAKVARQTRIHRVTLHRIMSKKGNPRLHNLANILHSFGLKFAVVPGQVPMMKHAA